MVHSLNQQIEYIVTCQCNDMPKFAQEAYSMLFPDNPNPELLSSKSNITHLADQYPNSEFQKYLKGLARSKEKFAYLFKVTENGEIKSLINLKTGAKVA